MGIRKINEIIIHCSDSDVKAHDDIKVIRDWHVNERGWSDVGYHYFIRKDGTIQKGRLLDTVGAHCKGHNKHSVGVCLSGRHKFTQRQFDALEMLIDRLYVQFGAIPVYGHYEFSKKTCPNFDVEQFMIRQWETL